MSWRPLRNILGAKWSQMAHEKIYFAPCFLWTVSAQGTCFELQLKCKLITTGSLRRGQVKEIKKLTTFVWGSYTTSTITPFKASIFISSPKQNAWNKVARRIWNDDKITQWEMQLMKLQNKSFNGISTYEPAVMTVLFFSLFLSQTKLLPTLNRNISKCKHYRGRVN